MNYPLIYISVTDAQNQLVIDGNLDLLRQFIAMLATGKTETMLTEEETKPVNIAPERSPDV